MRTKRTLLNMAYALGSSLLLLLLGLVTRRLLVDNFGPQITTASQVVSQLFNFSRSQSSASAALSATGCMSRSPRKMREKSASTCRCTNGRTASSAWSLRGWHSSARLCCGGSCPILPAATAYTVYGLNVVSTLCSYFLITRRLMYTCTQQGYRCTQIDFCCNVATSLAKIAVSLWLPNYVLYFSVTIFFNVMANLIIARRFKKDFPYVHDVKVTVNDFKELGIFHDLRYFWYTVSPTRSTARRIPS